MPDDVSAMNYETAVAELERTVQQLGQGQDDLAASVRTYERGIALARRCVVLIGDAERRLREDQPGRPGALGGQ